MNRERFTFMETIHGNSNTIQCLQKRLSMGKGKKKKKSAKKRNSAVEISSLYNEDLGTQGVKRLRCEDKKSTLATFELPMTASEKKRRNDRKARFESKNGSNGTLDNVYKPLASGRSSEQKAGPRNGRFVGESTNLEKPYLRLTDYPRKEDVRPLEVLVKSLSHIKNSYIRYEDFDWANEQLKSVRQDLTVQGLRNTFVLEVYETHARILLEHGDLNEFNQCQTVIRSLSEGSSELHGDSACEGIDGNAPKRDCQPLDQSPENADEFRGYAILYALVRKFWTQLKLELSRVKTLELGSKLDNESSAVHALQVVKAVEDCDFRTFFRLYDSAPHLSAYLMDYLVKRVRENAYERIISAYRPTVSVEYIRDSLKLKDMEETRLFLRQRNASFVREQGQPLFWVDCKGSSVTV